MFPYESMSTTNLEQQVIAKCGCLKLRHMADNSIFDQLSGTERKAAENYLKKPFAILW